jgi:hypothetical protein
MLEVPTGGESPRKIDPRDRSINYYNAKDLLEGNPVASITNSATMTALRADFNPARFDAVQLARVLVYNPNGRAQVKMLVVDGMNRTVFARDNADNPKYPYLQGGIPGTDITDHILGSSRIPPSEREDGQSALTMLQYLREIVPFTKVHADIAPDRIAAHVINAWESLVGAEVVTRFPAVAALNLLSNRKVPKAQKELLRKYLSEQQVLVQGETPQERSLVTQALIQVNEIIIESELNIAAVERRAFFLTATMDSSIGGEPNVAAQVHGLLNLPQVTAKLNAEPGAVIEVAASKYLLGQEIINKLKAIVSEDARLKWLTFIVRAVQHPQISIDDIYELVKTSDNIDTTYRQIISGHNLSLFRNAYMERLNNQKLKGDKQPVRLSDFEEKLLRIFGYRFELDVPNVPAFINALLTATQIFNSYEGVIKVISRLESVASQNGIDISFDVAKVKESLADYINDLENGGIQSIPVIQRRNREYGSKVESITKEDIRIKKIIRVLAELEGVLEGNTIRPQILEFLKDYSDNPEQIKAIYEKLGALDHDLHLQVIQGSKRLEKALVEMEKKKQIEEKLISETKAERTTPPGAPLRPTRTEIKALERASSPVSVIGPETTNRRIDIAKRILAELLPTVEAALRKIDIDQTELPPALLQQLIQVINGMGDIAYGEPNIEEIVKAYKYNKKIEIARLEETVRKSETHGDGTKI